MSVISKASLVLIPSGYGEDILYSEVPNTTAGDFTFTRASSGTRVNADGYIEEVPWNLSSNSQPTSGVGFQTGVVFQQTDVYDWNGVYYGDNTIRRVAFFPNTTIVGQTYTFSVFVKLTDGSTPSVGNSATDDFRMLNGAATTNSLTITDLGNGIFRCSVVRAATSTTTNVAIEKQTYNSAKTFEVSGYQLNKGTSVKPYIKTTDRLDIPRLDYTDSSCPTLLLEGQRTNVQRYSEQLDNSTYWIKYGVTISANDTISPDENQTADKVIYSSGSAGSSIYLLSNVNIDTSNPTTYSAFIKYVDTQWIQIVTSASSKHYANFDLQNGILGDVGIYTEASIEDYGNGWYRCICTFDTLFNGAPRFYTINSSSATWASGSGQAANYHIWGINHENNATYPTSYIPTSGTSVTRVTDQIPSQTLDTALTTEGTIYIDFEKIIQSGQDYKFTNTSGTTSYAFYFYSDGIDVYNGSAFIVNRATLEPNNSKVAVSWNGTNVKVYINGNDRTKSGAVASTNNTEKISFNDTADICNMNAIILFAEQLTDDELQELTTI